MKVRRAARKAGREKRMRRLRSLGRRITRLCNELETLNFIQDRLERELEARARAARTEAPDGADAVTIGGTGL